MPMLCNYYLTLRCNALCDFCNIPQTNNASPPPESTMAQVRENLRDLKRLGVKLIDFTGGEPTLFRHLVPTMTLAKQMGFITSMTNNGMLYPKHAEALSGKVDALVFSLESSDRAENDRVRGVKCYDKVLQSVRIAHELDEHVIIGHVVTNEAMSKVDEMIEFAKSLDAILYLSPCFSFFGNEGLHPDNAQGLVKYFNTPGVIVDRAQLKLVISGGNRTTDPVCRAISSTVVISPDNKLVLPCHHFRQDGLPIDGDLFGLYRSKAVRDARVMEGRHDFCEGCSIYCYMRGSLFRRHPLDSFWMTAHYVNERFLQKLRRRARGGRGMRAVLRTFWHALSRPAPARASAAPMPRRSLPLIIDPSEERGTRPSAASVANEIEHASEDNHSSRSGANSPSRR